MNPIEAFELLELRVGRITSAQLNEKTRKPAYKLWIDFGTLGERTSSAQITDLYTAEQLIGRQVVCVMNLGERNIAGFVSQVLVLGVNDEDGQVILLATERDVPLGQRVY